MSLVTPLAESHDLALVGGKAINLARMIAAGFDVPSGFVVTTRAFEASGGSGAIPGDVAAEIEIAYRDLGSPVVAVRSSATAEDTAGASMAGQYETYLDIVGAGAVIDAVRRCWTSIDSPRSRAYLSECGIDLADVSMAVVVQTLVPADVAGVLFTANPRNGVRAEMLAEANWGLGESVVSGKVQPDTMTIDRASGAVLHCAIGTKETWIQPGSHAELPVAADRRGVCCLKAADVRKLWQLGVEVMAHFGTAQDIEWAMSRGRLYVLQSRAVTTLEDAEELQSCLQRTRAELHGALDRGRGGWLRHNLAETLSHPTPLTWSVIRRFMSGSGGFGAMYREIGFAPSPTVCREGFLDLIAGRVYMDLKRAPELFFEGFPWAYDVALLRSNPDAAQQPPTLAAGSFAARLRAGRQQAGVSRRIAAIAVDLDRHLDQEVIPAFRDWVDRERERDLAVLDAKTWVGVWQERERRILDEFAPKSLLPSVLAVWALGRLRDFLAEQCWDDDPDALAGLISAGGAPDRTVAANDALFELAHGAAHIDAWMAEFGHRASDEMDLSAPRWHERPDAVRAMAAHLVGGARPRDQHRRRVDAAAQRAEQLAASLTHGARAELVRHLDLVHRYLRFREDGKYHLMRGYALMREMALDAGRRLEIGDDVFLLTSEELGDSLATGFPPLHLIESRRAQRAAEVRVSLPPVIDADDIADLGAPPPLQNGDRIDAFPISAGASAGPARILASPDTASDLGRGYVLVCSSTDPSWTPLFVNAAGLVMECGGSLSHGAVVAREMGIPAVVVQGATKLFKNGDHLLVDGHRGCVVRADQRAAEAETAPLVDSNDTRIAAATAPPPPGPAERRGSQMRYWGFLVWGAYLLAAFGLPERWLYRPTMAFLDSFLIPLTVTVGRPMTVAIVAAAISAATMIAQRLVTDNPRLLVGKRRAAALTAEALALPVGAPRRSVLLAAAAPMRNRLTQAAFVPLALLLGPMVMTFMWFPARVDPASWNPDPGAIAHVTARVDADCPASITARIDRRLTLDESSPATQIVPPVRATLEKLLGDWQRPQDLSGLPWEVQASAQRARAEMLDDLQGYLARGIPPQNIAWTVITPDRDGGRFAFEVIAADHAPQIVHLVTGSANAPEPTVDLGDGKPVQGRVSDRASDPIRSIRVTYTENRARKTFWQPFAALGSPREVGWVWTYLLAYLPSMVILRRLLRLA